MGSAIWKRFHERLQPTTPAYCDVYNALWQEAKHQGCSVRASRATLAAMSGRTERTTRSATTFWEEQGLLRVERQRLAYDKNAINIYHLRHVWIHWFRWAPSKKTLHKRATDLGDPPHPSKREKIFRGPAQKCSEEVASRVHERGSWGWYVCQGLTPPWEEEDKKKVPGGGKE
jgi:hypothetical protein